MNVITSIKRVEWYLDLLEPLGLRWEADRHFLHMTQEVVKLTGATYRQVAHWAAEGFIPGQARVVGSGQAHWRRWFDGLQ